MTLWNMSITWKPCRVIVVDVVDDIIAGYEIREYMLEKWHRTCAYCGAKDVRLEIEHMSAKSKKR